LVTGVFNYVPNILELYYSNYLFGNIVELDKYIGQIYDRSIGLLGHPSWLGLMMYLLGKFLSFKHGKYRYTLIAGICIVLSGGRAAMLIMVTLEFFTLVYNNRYSIMKKIKLLTGL